jgi:iron complex transport system permease protein
VAERALAWRPARLAPLPLALLLLFGCAAAAFSVGAFPVGPRALLAALAAWLTGTESPLSPAEQAVLWSIRGPRVLAAGLIGAGLAAAGAAYQGLFRNPLVSPDLLGVSSGAALGAVLGIFLALPVLGIQLAAFAGGLLAVAAVYALAGAVRGHDPLLVLVLGGVAVGALLGAGVALLKFLADPYNQLPAITFWLLGSLASVDRTDVGALLPVMLVSLVPLVLLRWRMDVMTMGDEEARALGVDVRAVRLAVVTAATLMTAAAVAVAGIVGWVGLLVPHMARLVVGPAFARLLPMSALLGAAFLIAVDTLARGLGRVELPLGVLTAALGTPAFLWLLFRGRRAW